MPGLDPAEAKVFGEDAYYHPITGGIIEVGTGAFPVWRQALLHCQDIEIKRGKKVADALHARIIAERAQELEGK